MKYKENNDGLKNKNIIQIEFCCDYDLNYLGDNTIQNLCLG
jgi:hypothetical protein